MDRGVPAGVAIADGLRSGRWLTASRLWAYPIIVSIIAWLALGWVLGTSSGGLDRFDRPVGTDFANVWAAGRLALEGKAADAFDAERHAAAQRALFGPRDKDFYGWHYPPYFLLVAAPLGLLGYIAALVVWQGATLPLYLATVHRILPRRETWAAALGFPAVFVNLGHGHNGFLTAALFAGGLLLLDRRPAVAGLLIGLLAYKPQFGVLLPLALAASGRWRVIVAAAATVGLLTLLTWLLFGRESWVAVLDNLAFTRQVVLEQGGTGWHKIQSLFAALRAWGAPVWLAYLGQAMLAVLLAAGIVLLWRRPVPFALQAAALATTALLATPYCLDYDLVLLAPAIAWMAADGLERGFLPYDKTALAAIWATPLVARTLVAVTLVPLGLIAMLGLCALIWRRARLSLPPA